MEDKVRVHIWVVGRVQGVGFRAHVVHAAQQAGVTGWVRNVGYDRVEALAEGEKLAVEAFIEAVKSGPRASRVDQSQVDWEAPTGEFKSFSARSSM